MQIQSNYRFIDCWVGRRTVINCPLALKSGISMLAFSQLFITPNFMSVSYNIYILALVCIPLLEALLNIPARHALLSLSSFPFLNRNRWRLYSAQGKVLYVTASHSSSKNRVGMGLNIVHVILFGI